MSSIKFFIIIYFTFILYILLETTMTTDNNDTHPRNTDQAYLDICNDFKEVMDKKEEELIKYKRLYMDHKKMLCKIYGLSRTIDHYLDNYNLDRSDNLVSNLIEVIRGDCSEVLFSREEIDLGLNEELDEINVTINLV